jgi:predicted kinase
MAVEPPLLVMLVGLPGSGKSIAAKRLASVISSQGRPCEIIGTDVYLEAEAARRGLSYATMFAEQRNIADAIMWRQAREAVRRRISVIWDQTNLTVNARRQRLRLFPKDYLRIAAVMPAADDKARERNLARGPGRAVPEHVFDRMRAEWRRPSREEGFQMFL